MRHSGRKRAWAATLARRLSLYVLVGILWAVGFADPAGAPVTGPSSATVTSALYEDLTAAIAARTAELGVAASRSAPPAPPPPSIVWPAQGQLTGWFGERRGSGRHPGLDIDGATGDPVAAAAAGRVTVAGASPAGYGGYGLIVMIDHGDGLVSISAHLSKVLVRVGEEVTPGQRVGSIGTTGSVTGSHLHLELRRRGVQIDPKPWLSGKA